MVLFLIVWSPGESETLPDGSYTFSIRAEVGLLSHNILIRSDTNFDDFGGRVVIGVHNIQDEEGFYQTYRGRVRWKTCL